MKEAAPLSCSGCRILFYILLWCHVTTTDVIQVTNASMRTNGDFLLSSVSLGLCTEVKMR